MTAFTKRLPHLYRLAVLTLSTLLLTGVLTACSGLPTNTTPQATATEISSSSSTGTPGGGAGDTGEVAATLLAQIVAQRGELTKVALEQVIDGDTIVVTHNRQSRSVRMIGIDTPETKHPNKGVEPFGPEASANLTNLLSDKTIWLEFDPTQGRTDKYDRLLAYVWVGSGASGPTALANLDQLHAGLATEYTYSRDYLHRNQFLAAQRHAQDRRLGLWG